MILQQAIPNRIFDFVQTFLKFIKAVSEDIFDVINAVSQDKPLISIGLYFWRSSSPILGQWMKERYHVTTLSAFVSCAVLWFSPTTAMPSQKRIETNRKKFERLEKRAAKIIFGAHHQQDHMFRSFVNTQNMQCADFVFRCLNRTAPDVFYGHFEKVGHQQATRVNGLNLKIPKVKTESPKKGFFYSGVKIYNALPTHLKTEKFYLPFKQGLKEHFMDWLIF